MTAFTPDEQDSADMAQLAAGHDTALNDLMERHAERLFHYLIRQLQNETEAADLAQETFVRVYQNSSRYDARQKFSSWLYAIATNLVRDRFRWRSRHPNVSLDHDDVDGRPGLQSTLPELEPTPREAAQIREQAEMVQNAIAKLPEDLRTPLILFEYEEKSHAEIAEMLHCSAKAVELRLYRARQKLREQLSKILNPT